MLYNLIKESGINISVMLSYIQMKSGTFRFKMNYTHLSEDDLINIKSFFDICLKDIKDCYLTESEIGDLDIMNLKRDKFFWFINYYRVNMVILSKGINVRYITLKMRFKSKTYILSGSERQEISKFFLDKISKVVTFLEQDEKEDKFSLE